LKQNYARLHNAREWFGTSSDVFHEKSAVMQWSVKRKGAAESNARFVDPTGLKSAVLNSEVVLEQKNASFMDNQPGQSPLNSIPDCWTKRKGAAN